MIVEATLTLMVSDVDRALEFYTKTLGLSLKEKYGSKYAEVEINGLVIGLHLKNAEASSVGESNSLLIGFRVEDLQESISRLRNRSVKFSEEEEEGVAGKFAYFTDPDGHVLYLWQRET